MKADEYSNKLATLLGFIARFHLTPSRYFSLVVISPGYSLANVNYLEYAFQR